MRSKPSTRYYCGFCNKGGNSVSAMARHERHCTMNPARVCRMCALACNDQLAMPELVACLQDLEPGEDWFDKETWRLDSQRCMAVLREKSGGCPACILAAIRQRGLVSYMVDFDWDKESRAWFDSVNDANDIGVGGPGRC